jgi:excisionase family DNA binding protein
MNTEPVAFTVAEAAAAARTSRTKLYAAVASGALPLRKNGRRSIVLVSDLRRWLENLPVAR